MVQVQLVDKRQTTFSDLPAWAVFKSSYEGKENWSLTQGRSAEGVHQAFQCSKRQFTRMSNPCVVLDQAKTFLAEDDPLPLKIFTRSALRVSMQQVIQSSRRILFWFFPPSLTAQSHQNRDLSEPELVWVGCSSDCQELYTALQSCLRLGSAGLDRGRIAIASELYLRLGSYLQIFSVKEKLQLDVYGLQAVLQGQIQTDDSFVLNRILVRLKESIQHLPPATEDDDQVLHELEVSSDVLAICISFWGQSSSLSSRGCGKQRMSKGWDFSNGDAIFRLDELKNTALLCGRSYYHWTWKELIARS